MKANLRRRASRRAQWLVASAVITGLAAMTVEPPLADAAPPSPGAILHQLAPPPVTPSPPGQVLTLPAPRRQVSESKVQIPVKRLVIRGNHLIPTAELQALVRPAEGRKLTLGALRGYVDRITEAYQKRGYPVAYAYLPAQTIRDGVITIAVVEPRYDQVVAAGTSRLRPGITRRTAGVRPGETIAAEPLQRGLLLLNQTPGVQIKGMLVPGRQPGTSTLRIERHDLPVVTAALSENDYGNRYTGKFLTNVTVGADDPFGFGSSLAVNGILSNTGGLKSGGFEATSPDIWNGLRAGLYGSASSYRLGGSFNSLDEVGRATQLGGDLSFPLILQPGRLLTIRFDALEDWLAQSTRSVGAEAAQTISLQRITLYGAVADRWGGTTSGSLALSHGTLSIAPAAARALDAAGPQTAGSFVFAQAQLGRTQTLPHGFALSLSASGQLSGQNLDSSQQFYLGGPYGVMGYAVGDGGGDEGYLLRARLSHRLPVPRLPGQLSGSLLAQNGTVWTRHTSYRGATGPERLTLSGVGLGLGYVWGRLDLTAAYVRRIGANGAPGFSTSANQFWFQLGITL